LFGFKVVVLVMVEDVKGLLISVICDLNLVCYFEYKGFYWYVKGEVLEGDYVVFFGEVRVVWEGGELSVIVYGFFVLLVF